MPPTTTQDGEPEESKRRKALGADGVEPTEALDLARSVVNPKKITRRVYPTLNPHADRIRIYGPWTAICSAILISGKLLMDDKPGPAAVALVGAALLIGLGVLLNPPRVSIRPGNDEDRRLPMRGTDWYEDDEE